MAKTGLLIGGPRDGDTVGVTADQVTIPVFNPNQGKVAHYVYTIAVIRMAPGEEIMFGHGPDLSPLDAMRRVFRAYAASRNAGAPNGE